MKEKIQAAILLWKNIFHIDYLKKERKIFFQTLFVRYIFKCASSQVEKCAYEVTRAFSLSELAAHVAEKITDRIFRSYIAC